MNPVDEILKALRPAIEGVMVKLIQEAATRSMPDEWGKCSDCGDFEGESGERTTELLGPDFCGGFEMSCNGKEIRCCFSAK